MINNMPILNLLLTLILMLNMLNMLSMLMLYNLLILFISLPPHSAVRGLGGVREPSASGRVTAPSASSFGFASRWVALQHSPPPNRKRGEHIQRYAPPSPPRGGIAANSASTLRLLWPAPYRRIHRLSLGSRLCRARASLSDAKRSLGRSLASDGFRSGLRLRFLVFPCCNRGNDVGNPSPLPLRHTPGVE